MIDIEATLAAWNDRGFAGGTWVDPPGQTWERCVHHADQLIVLLDGSIELVIEDLLVRPTPGEEVLIPAGAVHSVRNIGSTEARWLFADDRGGGEPQPTSLA